MAGWLAARGHQVRVVTAPAFYPEWLIGKGFSVWKFARRKTCFPLPVLWTPDELPQSMGVLPGRAPTLAQVAQLPHTGKAPYLGDVRQALGTLSAFAPAHHPRLDGPVSPPEEPAAGNLHVGVCEEREG